jgi:diaminopimelate decarboxylase
MELFAQFIDIILHLDKHLAFLLAQYGPWIYAILFVIIFCETGLVVTPVLPGDSLLFALGTLCVGGGEPVALDGSDDPEAQARAFRDAADAAWEAASGPTPTIRAIEPGRALVAAATHLIARVLHVRERKEIIHGTLALPGDAETTCERQVILDAGMSELIRPALYGARHPITALRDPDELPQLVAVHGPICESTDAFGAHKLPRSLGRGDLLAIAGAGAYADAMWSPYNSRPRPARVLFGVGGIRTLRKRSAETA